MSDDVSPRWVGDLSRPLECTFVTHDGSADPISGASGLTIKFRNRSSGVTKTGQGTWTITDGTNGLAVYTWAAADVADPGFFDVQTSATLTDGPAHWDAGVIEWRNPI